MDIKKVLDIVHQADPEVYEKVSPRRDILKTFGSKVAIAAVPLALGSMFRKAYGKSTDVLSEVLLYALKLEYLEAGFYRKAGENLDKLPSEIHNSISKLAADEQAHVNFLKNLLISMMGYAPDSPAFDFTGGEGSGSGPFADVFSNYETFLAVAQIFEDTGVRAYKGQLTRVNYNDDAINNLLSVHSVEARHAAHIRYMRKLAGHSMDIKPWITADRSEIKSNFVQRPYNGEDVRSQLNVQITNINGFTITGEQASEAFDEPLREDAVEIIITPFIAK